MTVELGLIHPPVGMNVFVIKSVVQEVTFSTIFRGVVPFIVTDLIRLVILITFQFWRSGSRRGPTHCRVWPSPVEGTQT
jgi:TRAP-type C4-dicarboxylate transport system permease large subunit